VSLRAGFRIDVGDAARLAVLVEGHLSNHCVGDERQASGFHRRRDEHVGRREVRIGATTAIALAAVVTRHSTVVVLGQDRKARGNAGDVQAIGGVLHHQLIAAWRRRRQEVATWMVRQIVVVAEDANQLVDAIIPWRHI
jgi:hypothetical protein